MKPAPKNAARQPNEAGFTLVEVLVAFTVFSLLSLLVLEAMQFGTKAWKRGNDHASRLEESVHAHSLLRRLIDAAYPSFIELPAGAGYVEFEGDAQSLNFLSEGPMSLDKGGRFHFTLFTESRSEQTHLVLSSRPELAFPGNSAMSTRRTLLANIAKVNFAYFGRKRGGGPTQWHEDWRKEREFPELVRVEVTFGGGDAGIWPALIIRPRIEADVSCVYDTLAKRCRGR